MIILVSIAYILSKIRNKIVYICLPLVHTRKGVQI
jgi:hypothetical protein